MVLEAVKSKNVVLASGEDQNMGRASHGETE
jgi:hypothetical protein